MVDLMRKSDLLKEQLKFLKEHNPTSPDIDKLEKTLKRSKQGRSSKVKGANYERKIVKLLEETFPNLSFGRTPASGGYKKEIDNNNLRGDVVCLTENVDFQLHLELKNRKDGWKVVQDWFKQAESDCIKGKTPCVIMHQNLVKGTYSSQDFIMLKLNDFFNLIDYKKVVKLLDK
jgi:hypothetical protein